MGFGDGEADAITDTDVTYTLVSSAGTSNFSVGSINGVISIASSAILDYETEPGITLTVTIEDSSGATAETTVDIDVIDQDEAPIYTWPGYFGIDEDESEVIGRDLWDALDDPDGDAFGVALTILPAATSGLVLYEIGGIDGAWAPAVTGVVYLEEEVKSFTFHGPAVTDVPAGTAPSSPVTSSFATGIG